MINLEVARHNMVESQIRPSSVTDRRLIAAMSDIPQEAYLPSALRSVAYMDEDIVLSAANETVRAIMRPMVFAKLVQLAEIEAGDLILDIGCATGYSTAILARLGEAVVALECDEALAAQASETLIEQGVDNAAVVTGPLHEGYAGEGPYDVIVLNGAVPQRPDALIEQLKPGGRLVAVVGDGPVAQARLYSRHDVVAEKIAFDAKVAPLPGFAASEPAFVF